ncbi:MAG: hypothetical protein ACYTAO_22625, partial [Planctomycetota bacterium]
VVALTNSTDTYYLKANLAAHTRGHERYQGISPLLIWFLVKIILPIVIKLVLEWWKNRNQ